MIAQSLCRHRDGVRWLVLGLCVSVGCAKGDTSESDSRVYVDDLRRTVEIPVHPKRVVSLAPNLTEIVFVTGAGGRIVAVTMADDYPPEVDEIAHIGAFPLNHEAVVAQSPDLILATDQVNSPHDIEPISELGIPSVFLQFATVDDVISGVVKVGDILGTQSAAKVAADNLSERWALLQSASAAASIRPKLLLLIGYDILYAFGSESYTNQMIAAAGAESVTEGLPGQSAVLSEEFVLGRDPDIIVVAGNPNLSTGDLLEHHPSWDAVPAVRNNHVFSINPDLVLRPGPRVIEGAERLSEIVTAVKEAPIE